MSGLTHTVVGIVALRRFATRSASQLIWREDELWDKAVPPLQGAGLSQRDNLYRSSYPWLCPQYASALFLMFTRLDITREFVTMAA